MNTIANAKGNRGGNKEKAKYIQTHQGNKTNILLWNALTSSTLPYGLQTHELKTNGKKK